MWDNWYNKNFMNAYSNKFDGYYVNLEEMFPLNMLIQPQQSIQKNKFDQDVSLRNDKKMIEKQMNNFFGEIEIYEKELKFLKEDFKKKSNAIENQKLLLKNSYLELSRALLSIDQKLIDLHK